MIFKKWLVQLTLAEASAAIATATELIAEGDRHRGPNYRVLAPATGTLLLLDHRAYPKPAWPVVLMDPCTDLAELVRNHWEPA